MTNECDDNEKPMAELVEGNTFEHTASADLLICICGLINTCRREDVETSLPVAMTAVTKVSDPRFRASVDGLRSEPP
ncbi:hypothetical protein EVAR_47522_1 [Eumeta japonica]|uniref:Uncharacterized protein n=1 Tax=Eumeta variegata TaxID=151549 RepID=A0A4C1XSN5_EUMVA|nr:hypothetical protein EVAR_47522_1 [Eumeta japonica]